MTLPPDPTLFLAHCKAHKAETKAILAKEPALFLRFRNTLCNGGHRQFNSSYQDEERTYNREFAAMLADEYILNFISLSAHIRLTEFYQLLLLSSSSVFQSAAAPGWTLKNTSTAASSGRYLPKDN